MKRLKNVFMALMIFGLLVLSVPAYSQGITFGLKLGGGINYMLLTDYNNYVDGWNTYLDYFNTTPGSYKNIHMGMDFSGEFILYFTPSIGVGFGGGFLSASVDHDEALFNPMFPVTSTISEDIKISAIPLKLSFHYNTSLSNFMNFFFNVGVGYYFGTLDFNVSGYMWPLGNSTQTANANMTTIGFHGGLGLEFKFSPNISFFIEVQGRYAKFSEVKGDYSYITPISNVSGEHTLYHYIYTGSYTITCLGWYKEGDTPSLPTYSDIRKAIFDLTGAAVRVGFMIRFGNP